MKKITYIQLFLLFIAISSACCEDIIFGFDNRYNSNRLYASCDLHETSDESGKIFDINNFNKNVMHLPYQESIKSVFYNQHGTGCFHTNFMHLKQYIELEMKYYALRESEIIINVIDNDNKPIYNDETILDKTDNEWRIFRTSFHLQVNNDQKKSVSTNFLYDHATMRINFFNKLINVYNY